MVRRVRGGWLEESISGQGTCIEQARSPRCGHDHKRLPRNAQPPWPINRTGKNIVAGKTPAQAHPTTAPMKHAQSV